MENQVQYGGFWIRQVAGLIDTAVFCLLYFGLQILFPAPDQYYLYISIYVVAGYLYYILCLSSKWQGTVGFKAMNLKVVTKGLQKPGIATVIWRVVLFMLPGLPFFIFMFKYNATAITERVERETAAFADNPEVMGQYIANNEELLTYGLVFVGVTLLSTVLCLVWFISIAFTKQKTGVHDLLSKTRVIHG